MSGESKSNKNGEGLADAYRVWEVKASRELMLRLRSLYFSVASAVERASEELERKHGDAFRREPERFSNELIGEASRLAGLPKGLFWYAVEWWNMIAEARGKSKLRGRFTPPLVPLLIKVVSNSDRLYGNANATAVLDASRGELRVPSAGVAVRLRPSLVRAVLEDVQRFGDVKLTM